MPDIEETLAERGSRYSDFRDNAIVAQGIKQVFHGSPNWHKLPGYMQEGLDMFASKMSRMLTGDFLYDDNIHDIIGYAKLMQDRMAQDRANPVEKMAEDRLRTHLAEAMPEPVIPGGTELDLGDFKSGDFVLGTPMVIDFDAEFLFARVKELGFLDSLGFALSLLGDAGFRVNDDGGMTNDKGETPDVVYQQHFHKSEVPVKVDGSKVPAPSFFRDPLRTVMTRDNAVTELSPVDRPTTVVVPHTPEEDGQLRQEMWDDHRGRVAWGYTDDREVAVELDTITGMDELGSKIEWLLENVLAGKVDLYNMRQEDAPGVYCLGAFEIPKN